MHPKKIIIVTNIPNPYRIPLFNKLNELFTENNLSLLVIFAGLGYKRRKWDVHLNEAKFDYEILNSITVSIIDTEKTLFAYNGLFKKLRHHRPDIIIVSGFSLATLQILFYSKLNNIRFIIWSGSINTRGRIDSPTRKLFRKSIAKQTNAFLAYGLSAQKYLLDLDVNAKQIFIAINTVDINFFSEMSQLAKKATVDAKEEKILLYVGNLTTGKRIDNLIKIVDSLTRSRNGIKLKLVGDGPEKEKLQAFSRQMNLEQIVIFEGFKQKEEIPKYLAEANIFLFPSEYDIWGLVLVEAMAAGLPCISSIYAGATEDLIQEGITGFTGDFGDHKYITERVNWLFENPDKAARIGQNAKQFIIENVSLEKSAEGFLKAVQSI